jgi:hypothetical protein
MGQVGRLEETKSRLACRFVGRALLSNVLGMAQWRWEGNGISSGLFTVSFLCHIIS